MHIGHKIRFTALFVVLIVIYIITSMDKTKPNYCYEYNEHINQNFIGIVSEILSKGTVRIDTDSGRIFIGRDDFTEIVNIGDTIIKKRGSFVFDINNGQKQVTYQMSFVNKSYCDSVYNYSKTVRNKIKE